MDIVHTYSAHAASHYDRSRDYTYQKQVIRRRFKRDHTLKSSTSETYEVLIVKGNPIETLMQRNGKPVTEQESLNRRREPERVSARVLPQPRFEDRFDTFELEGEEELNGRRAWIVSAGKSLHKGISHELGKFWIDEADFECARLKSKLEGT